MQRSIILTAAMLVAMFMVPTTASAQQPTPGQFAAAKVNEDVTTNRMKIFQLERELNLAKRLARAAAKSAAACRGDCAEKARRLNEAAAEVGRLEELLQRVLTDTAVMTARVARVEDDQKSQHALNAGGAARFKADEAQIKRNRKDIERIDVKVETTETVVSVGVSVWATPHGAGAGPSLGLSFPAGESFRLDVMGAAGLSLPAAQPSRLDTGLSKDGGLGYTLGARLRQTDGLWLGLNTRLVGSNQGWFDVKNGFMGGGLSIGWSGSHLNLTLDGAIGASGLGKTANFGLAGIGAVEYRF